MSDTHNDSTLAERDPSLFEDGADSLLSHAGLETPGSESGSASVVNLSSKALLNF